MPVVYVYQPDPWAKPVAVMAPSVLAARESSPNGGYHFGFVSAFQAKRLLKVASEQDASTAVGLAARMMEATGSVPKRLSFSEGQSEDRERRRLLRRIADGAWHNGHSVSSHNDYELSRQVIASMVKEGVVVSEMRPHATLVKGAPVLWLRKA